VAAGSFKRLNPPKETVDLAASLGFRPKPAVIQGSGYVVKSLEAALWAFYHSRSFKEGCLLAVNLGDDADTTGAVYGQLAGAYYGQDNIPAAWRNRLAMREMIEALADKLLALNGQKPA
jgi:ADP-ribosylglycohydrolase